MNKILTILILTGFATLLPQFTMAQKNKEAVCKIQTSAQCFMCKERIEKDLAYEKGVNGANLSLENMVLTVRYNPQKTTPEKIRQRVTKVGYDADDLPADQKAYDKLPRCCQKGGHPEVEERPNKSKPN